MKRRSLIATKRLNKWITNNPLVEIGGETYDRRTVTEIEVKKGVRFKNIRSSLLSYWER